MGDLVINPFLTKESTVPSPIRAKEKMDKNCKKKSYAVQYCPLNPLLCQS